MGLHRRYVRVITRASAASSGNQVLTGFGGKPQFMVFKALDNNNSGNFSLGISDTEESSCTATVRNGSHSLSLIDAANSFNVQDSSGNGWTGILSSLDSDGMTIAWTKLGSGLNVTIKCNTIL